MGETIVVSVTVLLVVAILCAAWTSRARSVDGELAELVSEPPDGWLSQRMHRRVIVHTADERSIEGLLAGEWPDGLVLRAATYLETGAELAGEVWVPRRQVLFAQVSEKDGSDDG